jgi:hypothetical protein
VIVRSVGVGKVPFVKDRTPEKKREKKVERVSISIVAAPSWLISGQGCVIRTKRGSG